MSEPLTPLTAPFPWFGGKSRAGTEIWGALGEVTNYVEPFCGSLAALLSAPRIHHTETVNDADGFVCLAPDTRLLAGDLRWVKAGDVFVGQKLIGFDENNGVARVGLRAPQRYRHWRETEVTAVRRVVKPCYRLTFDDGTTVVASEDHLWLGGSHASGGRGWRWQKTASLVCNRAKQRSWILKLCDVVEKEESYEAGWLSGFYDGEGHLRSAPGWRVHVTQKLGPEADLAERLLTERGFRTKRSARAVRSHKHQPVVDIALSGGMRETLRFLMQIRPERLIRKFGSAIGDMSLYGRSHQAVGLVSKEFIGDQEVVAVETTSHTFVAEGLASHNCNFWRSTAMDPEAVAHFADWPVNEADLEARHAWLVARSERLRWCLQDPDFFDAKIAGWWVWGQCSWIGTGWCSGEGPHKHNGANFTGNAGQGINRQLPHLGNAGQGINRKLPHLGDAGRGIADYIQALSDRLRRTRVACGDWGRVVTPVVTWRHGLTGVFLDPPYGEGTMDYCAGGNTSSVVASDVWAWAVENGSHEKMRIVVAAYEDGREVPRSWTVRPWRARKGYKADGGANARREVLYCSPGCLSPAQSVLGQTA